MKKANVIRVICNNHNTIILKSRMKKFFCENDFSFFNFICKPYWKEEGFDEIMIYLAPCPMWELEKWDKEFTNLFNQKYIIQQDTDGIDFCSYVSGDEMDEFEKEKYFVVFGIPQYLP